VVAFLTSLLITFLLVAVIFAVGKRRPVGAPITWGESTVAGTYVFMIMFWVYGVVPHLWLTWADNELKWRPDTLVADYIPGFKFMTPQSLPDGNFPMTITMQTLRDIIAVGIYVVFLGVNMYLFAWWQKRGTKTATTEIVTSDYGRPLVKKQPATAGASAGKA
jgi:hypothetical protein